MASLAALSSLIFLFLSLLPNLSAVHITLGSSLRANNNNSSWLSPSEEFAIGFHRFNNSDHFLVTIWFNKIHDRTIVWHANGDNPAPRGSKLQVMAAGLVLKDPKGQKIWEARPATSASEAGMLDIGNFLLIGNGSNYVWQSFKKPTDTLLPTLVLDLGSMLFSKLTETNFSKGRFELHFDNGSLQLKPVAWPSRFHYGSYYNSDTYCVNSSESANKLVFNESGDIYIVRTNGEIAQLPTWNPITPRTDVYHRATLDFDGGFGQCACSPTHQSWSLRTVN